MLNFDALLPILVYGTALAVVFAGYAYRRRRRAEAARQTLLQSTESGYTEPITLHPVINPNRCLGSGACVAACPTGDVLAVIGGQASLINPTHCIGHGRCQEACPTEAITLAIGSETRGIDIPVLGPGFETNVPGVFVAGELGGMGLIRNAIEQGRKAIESIPKLDRAGEGEVLDVLIVGAGPAGLGASLAAMERGLRFATLEQDTLGGSIMHHPRGQLVVTDSVDIPRVGTVNFGETSKESLLEFWERVRRDTGLEIRERERVEAIEPLETGFLVRSAQQDYETGSVILAVGRRGTPRRLDVPGEEESTRVVYRLVDAAQHAGKRVLVVGGGDSALESAVSVSEQPGTNVVLSYRGGIFQRPRPANRQKLEQAAARGDIEIVLNSTVAEIERDSVTLETPGGPRRIACDVVIVCAGGVLPNDFLRAVGVEIETKFGTPLA
ncbi:MAG: FAD-dependent oxidoreductase [Myxococcales bacterium]|nr:FAD-dependent oxidoreductase [Myxococcales bacterium]